MTDSISNSEDVIDSRDVIARVDELRSELEAVHEAALESDSETEPFWDWLDALADDSARELSEEATEFKALHNLAEQAEGYAPDWNYGETLIRDSYFQTYAEQLAEDCGLLSYDAAWPYTCIDWEKAARELRMDYTSVDFDGVTYWVR